MPHWGVDSYAECVDGLLVCLTELRDAYAPKGSDSNYEDEVELRHSAAIALKLPIQDCLECGSLFPILLVVNMSMSISRHNFCS